MSVTPSQTFLTPKEERKVPARHLEVGQRGEDAACRFLFKRGFRILDRNYKGPHGEIDIIAEKEGRIHFVEVKTRTSDYLGAPEERVDGGKRKALQETAGVYLAAFREPPVAGSQFDVVSQILDLAKNRMEQQILIEKAFEEVSGR